MTDEARVDEIGKALEPLTNLFEPFPEDAEVQTILNIMALLDKIYDEGLLQGMHIVAEERYINGK
jgi:hypothetical protein